MFAIETGMGRFEADDEKAAKKLLRKAKKAADAKLKIDQAKSVLADLRAKANAYDVLSRVAEGNGFPRGWRVKKPGDKFFKVKGEVVISGTNKIYDTAIYETENGTASFEHWGYRVNGILWNGAGFDEVTFLEDSEGRKFTYAVGVEGDQVRLAEIPGVTIEMFEAEPIVAE